MTPFRLPPIGAPFSRREMLLIPPAFITLGITLISIGMAGLR